MWNSAAAIDLCRSHGRSVHKKGEYAAYPHLGILRGTLCIYKNNEIERSKQGDYYLNEKCYQ